MPRSGRCATGGACGAPTSCCRSSGCYLRTGDVSLLHLWDVVAAQTADWGDWLQHPATGVTRVWDHMTHVVNVAMGLKTPALRSLRGDVSDELRLTDEGWANILREHGQVHGMFSGDEWLAGH